MPKVIQCCPNSPITGGKHQKPSKFCRDHCHLDKTNGNLKRKQHFDDTEITIADYENMSTRMLQATTNLPTNDDTTVHVGCKKAKDVVRVYNRTAGILAISKPCGIIVDQCEMYTCESPSQVFAFLLRAYDDKWNHINYVGYDRACEFEPFLKNLAKKGNVGAEVLLQEIEYLVDTFHCIKHTARTCMPLENNPDCKYHPRLKKFENIKGAMSGVYFLFFLLFTS